MRVWSNDALQLKNLYLLFSHHQHNIIITKTNIMHKISKVITFPGYPSSVSIVGFTKEPLKATALKRCFVMERRWKKKLDSLGSPVACVRWRPKSAINSRPLSLIGPSVSMATGTKMWVSRRRCISGSFCLPRCRRLLRPGLLKQEGKMVPACYYY